MRLLKRCDTGELKLSGPFPPDSTPPYAILSHTWDIEEVTFENLRDGTGVDKRGWLKIEFCAEQAQRDGLDYIWVDTCCIDKTNSTELQGAINSMFRWYRNAERCYVYLYVPLASENLGPCLVLTRRLAPTSQHLRVAGKRLFEKVDGSLEVGRCKSCSLRNLSSSSPASVGGLVAGGI